MDAATADKAFQWKPEWRKQLPVVRGVNVPPVASAEPLLARVPVVADGAVSKQRLGYWTTSIGRPAEPWTAGQWQDKLQAAAAGPADPAAWADLLMQARARADAQDLLAWLAAVGIHRHGIVFMMRATEPAYRAILGTDPPQLAPVLDALRHAIAVAEGSRYDEVEAEAEALHAQQKDWFVNLLLPHRLDRAQERIARGGWQDARDLTMRDCALPPEDYRRYLAANHWELADVMPGVLMQIHLHDAGAMPVLELLLDRGLGNSARLATAALSLITRMRSPLALELLLRYVQHGKVRDALEPLAQEHAQALLGAAMRLGRGERSRSLDAWSARLALAQPQALQAALAEAEPADAARFEAALAAFNPPLAPEADWPAVLRDPPWLRQDRPGALPVLQVAPIATPEAISWEASQLEQARAWKLGRTDPPLDAYGFPPELRLTPGGAQRLLAGEALQAGDTEAAYAFIHHIHQAPPAAQLALWNTYPSRLWTYSYWDGQHPILSLLAQHGVAALPGVLGFLGTHKGKAPQLALMIDSPGLVDRMTDLLRNSRMHRDGAARWIAKFPRTVLFRALPQAFAPEHSAVRDDARHAIRWLAAQGARDQVLDVAAAYGGEMPAAARALLDTDPLFVLPGVMPKLPAWFEAGALRRPLLRSGGAVSVQAAQHLASMLLLGRADAPYAGIALVKEACTPASIGDFAWDLYDMWAGEGAPSKENWAFRALGVLGDDETARRLLPRINEWSTSQSLRSRAEAALDLLATIGSDVALMTLNVLATKGRHKRVQQKAAAVIEGAAQARGLSLDELSDRLVPTLGLEEPGAQVLDFGPRRFHVAFDEALRPFVRDDAGARLKDLPRPNKSDDAEKSQAASARFRDLKKDVKTIASLQVTRLERALLLRRRWPAGDFRRLFLEHPLARHLAARLAWGVYEGERCVHALRVAEDWTLADAQDRAFPLPEDAVLGIAHPLEIPAAELAALQQQFADYEIVQPFRQLSRETFAPTPEERQHTAIARWRGKDVAAGSLLGMAQWRWQRGRPGDGGMIESYWRNAGGDLVAEFDFSPGIFVGGGMPEYRQTLGELRLYRADDNGRAPATFGQLDAVEASELLREFETLAPARSDLP